MPIIRPAVGSLTLLSLGVKAGGGELNNSGRKLVRIDREGADGIGLRRSAKKPLPVALRGKVDSLDATTAALIVSTTLPALEGTVVSLVIAGATHTNQAVLRAQCTARRPIKKPTGGLVANAGFLLDLEFDLIYAGT